MCLGKSKCGVYRMLFFSLYFNTYEHYFMKFKFLVSQMWELLRKVIKDVLLWREVKSEWDKWSASRPALLLLLLHRAHKDAPTYLAETVATKGHRAGSNNILFSQRLGAEGNRSE